jgi:hypothetical protein
MRDIGLSSFGEVIRSTNRILHGVDTDSLLICEVAIIWIWEVTDSIEESWD